MAGPHRFPRGDDLLWVVVAFIAGAFGIALGYLITSNVSGSDEPAESVENVSDDSSTTDSLAAADAASLRALNGCQRLASVEVLGAIAADTSLDQWRLHIDAMNQLVAGKISLDEATEYSEETRVDAMQNVRDFRHEYGKVLRGDLHCDAPDALVESSTRLQDRVEQCQRAIDALDELLETASTAELTWLHHIHDMNALRDGRISPAQATAAWNDKWHVGERQLEGYDSADRVADRVRCG